jgi:biotin operon repressor
MLSWKEVINAEKLGVSEADVLEMIKELKPKQYKKIVN